MFVIPSLLFGFSASIDSFIIGLSYGIKKYRISFSRNLLISFITLAGTTLSIAAGSYIAPFLSEKTAQILGSLILTALGAYYLFRFIRLMIQKIRSKTPLTSTDIKSPSWLTCKEALSVGAALSINNMGMGIGASMTGISLIPTCAATLFFSVFLLFLGNHIGKSTIFHPAERFADFISAIILIGLGIYEFFV